MKKLILFLFLIFMFSCEIENIQPTNLKSETDNLEFQINGLYPQFDDSIIVIGN